MAMMNTDPKPLKGDRKRKTNGGRSHTADTRTKRVATDDKITSQIVWRLDCLLERKKGKRLTDKNQKELDKLTAEILPLAD
jgi:ribosomal protein S19E (S16A)